MRRVRALKLAALLAEATFPLYAVPRRAWSGVAFVGTYERMTVPRPALRAVRIVYLDTAEPPPHGAVVSVLGPGAVPDARVGVLDPHLVDFVSRFDEAFVERRVRARRPAFPDAGFDALGTVVLGAGARIFRHRALPLQVVRLAVRRGGTAADVAVACWDLDAVDFASRLEPVDLTFAREFDAAVGEQYPPPEWGPVEGSEA